MGVVTRLTVIELVTFSGHFFKCLTQTVGKHTTGSLTTQQSAPVKRL